MVVIRIWGLLKPSCLPVYTATSDTQDSMSLLFRLLTKLWICCETPSPLLPSPTNLQPLAKAPPTGIEAPTGRTSSVLVPTVSLAPSTCPSTGWVLIRHQPLLGNGGLSCVIRPCISGGLDSVILAALFPGRHPVLNVFSVNDWIPVLQRKLRRERGKSFHGHPGSQGRTGLRHGR